METLIKLPNDSGNNEIVSSSLQTIVLPLEILAELNEYVRHYTTEISGCGMVERVESRQLVGQYNKSLVHTVRYNITEVFLPPKQENSSSHTEINEKTIGELATELIKQGKDVLNLKLHWHSHAEMNTFHSSTDVDNYHTLDNKEFLVSLVLNKKGSVLGRIDVFNPVVVAFTNVPVFVAVKVAETVANKTKERLEKLDTFLAEEKEVEKKLLTNQGDIAWAGLKRRGKIRRKLVSDIGITEGMAFKFETCIEGEHACYICRNAELCAKYNTTLNARLRGESYGIHEVK